MLKTRHAALALALLMATGACGSQDEAANDSTEQAGAEASEDDQAAEDDAEGSAEDADDDSDAAGEQKYPDIVEVEVERNDNQTASFSVTVSSPYDTPDRYADGWRVLDQDGEVLGEHMLGHDHAGEQPFTRRQSDVEIPEGTTELTIEGRDQENGYGGETVTVEW